MFNFGKYLESANERGEAKKIEDAYHHEVRLSRGEMDYSYRTIAEWLKKNGYDTIMIHKKGRIVVDDIAEEIIILTFKKDGKTFFAACNDEFGLFDVDTKPLEPRDYR